MGGDVKKPGAAAGLEEDCWRRHSASFVTDSLQSEEC